MIKFLGKRPTNGEYEPIGRPIERLVSQQKDGNTWST